MYDDVCNYVMYLMQGMLTYLIL